MFTGQWADLPFEVIVQKAKSFGYDGVELACWGDHFEVDKALSDDKYVREKRDFLEQHGMKCVRNAEAHGWMRSEVAIEGMLYQGEALYFSGAVRPALDCLQLRMQLCRLALGESIQFDLVQDRLSWTQLVATQGAFVVGNDAYVRMLRDLRMGHAQRCRGAIEAMSLSLEDVTAAQAPNVVRPILAAEVFSGSEDHRIEPMLRGFLGSLRRNEVWFTEMQVRMLLVLHLQNAGREDEAATELEGVLASVERMPYERMVVDFPQVRPLLVRSKSATARRLLHAMQMRDASAARRPCDLSATEVRVLKLLALGHSVPRVAEEMHVSAETVGSHTKNMYRKLGVHNRVDALRIAKEGGVV